MRRSSGGRERRVGGDGGVEDIEIFGGGGEGRGR